MIRVIQVKKRFNRKAVRCSYHRVCPRLLAEGWDYRQSLPYLVSAVLGIEPRALYKPGKHSNSWATSPEPMWIFKSTVRDAGESECWTAVLDFLMLRRRTGCIFSTVADRNRGGEVASRGGKESEVSCGSKWSRPEHSLFSCCHFPSPVCAEVWTLTCDLESSVHKDPPRRVTYRKHCVALVVNLITSGIK